jgi:FixJ family two-component response regulator
MNGLAVQSRMRDSHFKVQVVFITATEGLKSREQAMQSGAAAWLRKPVDDMVLLETIARALSANGSLSWVLD